jgi:hypothetical protein
MFVLFLHLAVGGSTVPAEYCEHSVDDNCNLAMLLPTLRGQGLCATALVHHMVQIHNDFIENYCRITKQEYVVNHVFLVIPDPGIGRCLSGDGGFILGRLY